MSGGSFIVPDSIAGLLLLLAFLSYGVISPQGSVGREQLVLVLHLSAFPACTSMGFELLGFGA